MDYYYTLHPFNGLFSGTSWLSRYQKDKTSMGLNEGGDDAVWGIAYFENWQIIAILKLIYGSTLIVRWLEHLSDVVIVAVCTNSDVVNAVACAAWVSARTAERCTPASSTATASSASTLSPSPRRTAPSSTSSSTPWPTPSPASSAIPAPEFPDPHRFRCGWRAPCHGLRRSGHCSICVGSAFASTPASTISSSCLCRPASRAGWKRVSTSGVPCAGVFVYWSSQLPEQLPVVKTREMPANLAAVR